MVWDLVWPGLCLQSPPLALVGRISWDVVMHPLPRREFWVGFVEGGCYLASIVYDGFFLVSIKILLEKWSQATSSDQFRKIIISSSCADHCCCFSKCTCSSLKGEPMLFNVVEVQFRIHLCLFLYHLLIEKLLEKSKKSVILCSVNDVFPQVSLNFEGGAQLLLGPQDYLLQQTSIVSPFWDVRFIFFYFKLRLKVWKSMPYMEMATYMFWFLSQDGAAVWCMGFQKIQGQGITILGGIRCTKIFISWALVVFLLVFITLVIWTVCLVALWDRSVPLPIYFECSPIHTIRYGR